MGSTTENSGYRPVHNPWAHDRVPGGSSGGSAAAVASGEAIAALGSDTGGSIRQPAALTGIVGMKPTYGRVSRYGIVAFASSLDQIGPFARDVRDAAALLHAIAGRDERDSTSAPIPVPDDLIALGEGDALGNYLATRGRGFGPEVKRRIMLGTYALSAGYYDAFYVKAQKVRTLIKRDFDTLFEQGFDALVAPTSPSVAFRFGAKMADPVAMYLSDACTLPVNMAGLPGISIPCGLSEGMPVGLQLIGRAWSEAPLFSLARAYEALTTDAPWRGQEPAQLDITTDPA